MPRKTVHLADPVRRRIGDTVMEARSFHLAQAEKRRSDAHGLAKRYREQMRALRSEMRYHAQAAADHREILEALR